MRDRGDRLRRVTRHAVRPDTGAVSEDDRDRGAGAPGVGGAGADPPGQPGASAVSPLTDEERAIIRLLARLALEEWLDGPGK